MNWIEDRAREAEQLENNKRQGNNFARAKKRERAIGMKSIKKKN